MATQLFLKCFVTTMTAIFISGLMYHNYNFSRSSYDRLVKWVCFMILLSCIWYDLKEKQARANILHNGKV